jgi:L-ribulose-5-phosphate 3-epimerase UlaE
VAALETPAYVIRLTAPHVKNIHVKDFHFTRQDGWVGFSLTGAPLGTGQLDYQLLVDTVRPADRNISRIIEHWLPWQGEPATTVALEQQWTEHNLDYLRSTGS